ncbi:MAG: 23S rRNA (adenine(2503)-C(2))-methyltransferase RlmN, partial [Alphaproteobacteria bacterium]|nr:23S rRNA (adenine(2503)-C(2))-methyltransferase RlmN [Alphaproteobacteria bacterium]
MSTTLDLSRRPAPLPGPRTLAGLSIPALRAEMESLGLDGKQAGMRAKQLRRWIHHFGARDFAVMTDIAKDLRARLADTYVLDRPEIADHQVSKDGTQK